MSSSRAPISMRVANAAASSDTPRPDRLPADDQVVVAARDDAHEAVARLERHARGRWRRTGTCALMQSSPACAASAGVQADDDDFGVGEAHGGDRGRCRSAGARPAMISATISPCAIARCASIGSPVTSPIAQTLRIDVRHWSSMLHGAAVHVEHQRLQPPAVGARPPADRDQHLVGRQRRLVALRVADAHRVAARVQPLHRAAEMQLRRRAVAATRPPAWSARRRRPAARGPAPRPPSPRRPACDTRCRARARCSRRRRRPGAAAALAAPAPRSTR